MPDSSKHAPAASAPPETDAPLVSVVISVYNGEAYLRPALDSILAQTFRDFEVVCIDDGSSDGSAAILAETAERDARVRVLSQANRGLIAALNRGVAEARGRLIARMDDDDLSHPERFERMVAVFEREPDTVLVSCNFRVFSDTKSELGIHDAARDAELIGWFLLFHNHIGGHSQVMYRRDAARDAGAYDADDLRVEDYGLWCRLNERGTVRILPDILQDYRFHAASVSRQNRDVQIDNHAVVARRHMQQMLGVAPSLEDVKTLQHFWIAEQAQPYVFPPVYELKVVDANLRMLFDAYLKTSAGRSLAPEAVRRLRRRVAERYLLWAERLALRSPQGRAVAARALRWDPAASAATLARRALHR